MTDTTINPDEGFAPSYEEIVDDQIDTDVNDQAAEDLDDEGDSDSQDEQEDEFEEVERGDKKYRIPKALKDELLRHDDYTRKTQALAEQRKALDAERVKITETVKEIDDTAFQLKAIERRESDLTALTPQDWNTIREMDLKNGTNRYDELMREFQLLPKQRDELKKTLDAKTQEALQAKQEVTAKQMEEGHAVLTRDIPGWGPELGAKLTEFVAKEYGITAEKHGAAFMDPAIIKLAHAAYKAKADTRKATTANVAAQANAIKPVPTARGGGAPSRDPNKMSAKEYADYRDKQVGPGR